MSGTQPVRRLRRARPVAGLRIAGEEERELPGLVRLRAPRAEAGPRLVGALRTLSAGQAPVADRQDLRSQYLDLRADAPGVSGYLVFSPANRSSRPKAPSGRVGAWVDYGRDSSGNPALCG
ncbi:hypothetical protein [Streptomyces sp. NBC_00078]|uniref:hypothetical protein n=1 Tax=unclassified Streptomyces TaxID=2593676 RepID=UPI002257B898|nr:hypothetical protein [Streptomyces sp. NBC_00078]MCX5423202.1 hypothetical protein [Streptomyces sp. NBC_00078]